MKITDAISLIETALPYTTQNSTWADLGCGTGTFTRSLAVLLGDGNKIYAVDKESQQIKSSESNRATIEFVNLNFITKELPFTNLDGILMANSLHYVKDKSAFVQRIKKHLKADGQMIIVEYDTVTQSPWVPYPISFDNLRKTFLDYGFSHIKKIGERNSIYRTGKIYACSIKH